MKKMMKLAVIGTLFAAGVAQTYAQTDPTFVTNTVAAQNLNISLTGFSQGGDTTTVTSVRITTKDILNALGTVFGTNVSKAKLVLLTPVDFEGASTIVTRQTVNRVNIDTDVSGFFTQQTVLAVEKSKTNSQGKTTGTRYSIDRFTFGGTDTNNATVVSFDVQGFTTTTLANMSFNSNVNGTGNVNGSDAVLRGTIKASGGKNETQAIEIVP